MKKFAKRIAAAGLVLMMAIGCLTGCNQEASEQSQTKLFSYDGTDVYLDEAWVYAKIAKTAYENAYLSYFGEDMWSMQVSNDENGNPVDFEDMVKGSVLSQIKQVIVLVNKAEELGVSLTSDEIKEAKEAAELFCSKSEGKAILEETGATEDTVRKIYEDNALASKVQKEAVKDVDTNVSDDEARQTTVYKLVFGLTTTDDDGNTVDMTDEQKAEQLAKAQDALAQIQSGTDMESLAETLGVSDSASETYGAGEAAGGEDFEAVMAGLNDGDVAPEVLTTEEGYVVAKLVAYTDEEATAAEKENIIADREMALYEELYAEWTESLEAEWVYEEDVDTEAWAKVYFVEVKELLTDTSLEVADGDKVNIDYVGTVDGVEFEGGNTNGTGTDLTIGSGSYIDDFEDQLIGAHPGDTVEVNVTFPEDYGNEELNGKDAVFTVTVNGIYED